MKTTESLLTDAKKEVSIGGVDGDRKVPTNPVSDCRDPVEPGNTLEPRQSGSICDEGRNTASPLIFQHSGQKVHFINCVASTEGVSDVTSPLAAALSGHEG